MAAFMETLTDAKLLCIHDHAGNLLIGKVPAPDLCVLSAEFISLATTLGYKGKK